MTPSAGRLIIVMARYWLWPEQEVARPEPSLTALLIWSENTVQIHPRSLR